MLEFMAQNPCRVPAWRWLRAQHIAHGGPVATVRRDGSTSAVQIGRATRFYKALQNCDGDERQLMKLAEQMPALFWAHYLYDQPDHPVRWEVEARILAGESDLEIARRVGCGVEIIQNYEALFFNVRDKLKRTDYIFTVVLSDAITRDLHGREKDLLWKQVAYTFGSRVLDALINPLVNPQWVASPDDIPDFYQDLAIGVVKKKAAIAALCIPINDKTRTKLIRGFGKFVKLERSTNRQDDVIDQINKGMGAMLDTFAVFGRIKKGRQGPRGEIVGIRPRRRRVTPG